MLTGKELIDLVEGNSQLNEMQLARMAGYVRVTKAGREQVLVKQMYEQLLIAQGVKVKPAKARQGKSAQFKTTVHRSGIVLVGKVYAKKFGLNPGDSLQIVIEDDCIKLVPDDSAALVNILPNQTASPVKLPALV